jgi:hypothetical protein
MHVPASVFQIVTVAVAFLAGVYGERWRFISRSRRSKRAFSRDAPGPRMVPAAAARTDAAEQLRIVMTAGFRTRPLLSKAEAKVFYSAERAIAEQGLPWRVMGQVSLGEILSSTEPEAYAAINSKRVDLLLIDRFGQPIAAIEYQGEGHYQGSAAARDAVKKEALRRAGVRYIEITPDHRPPDIAHEIARLAEGIAPADRGGGTAPPPLH